MIMVLNNLFANDITINLINNTDGLCATVIVRISSHHCAVNTGFNTTNNLVIICNGGFSTDRTYKFRSCFTGYKHLAFVNNTTLCKSWNIQRLNLCDINTGDFVYKANCPVQHKDKSVNYAFDFG